MQFNRFVLVSIFFLSACMLIVFSIAVRQMSHLEKRLISLSGTVDEVAKSSERLQGEMRGVRAKIDEGIVARPADGGKPGVKVAAVADVGNYLKPLDYDISAPGGDRDGTIIRNYIEDPKGFNIITENAADLSEYIFNYVGVQLADRNSWTNPEDWHGVVADRAEITSNSQVFKIHIKEGIKWHRPGNVDLQAENHKWMQGDHYLTAKDVKFTLDIMMNPQVDNGFIKNYYEDLASWELVDDYTIVLKWKKPYYGAITATLSLSVIPEFFYSKDENGQPFPPESLGLKFNNHWYNNLGMVGAGPYRMVKYEAGQEIRLERNDEYFDVMPAIKTIVWKIVGDDNLALLKLKSHEFNFAGLRQQQYKTNVLDFEGKSEAERQKNPFTNGEIAHEKYLGMNFYYLGWNMDKPMFADKRVRQAMTMAFNREGIVKSVFAGLGRIISQQSFILSPGYDTTIQPYPFDLAKAAALLKEVGWEDTNNDGVLDKDLTPNDSSNERTKFQFSFLIYDSSAEYLAMANTFKDDLRKIGVVVNIEAVEWSLMQKRMDEKQFDVFTGGWGLDWDDDPYQIFHSSQADTPKGSNRVGFRNAEADKIIVTLRQTFDQDERIRLLHRFNNILHEEQPYTFFFSPELVGCWWPEVHLGEKPFARVRPHSNSLPWWVASRP